MENSNFDRLPAEIFEHFAQYLDLPGLAAFRLTCAEANRQLSGTMRRRYYATQTTSLLGDNLQRLEAIASNETLRNYVKTIYIEDGFRRDESFPPPRTSDVWPRNSLNGLVNVDALGVASIRNMLIHKLLRPERIVIRDYRDEGCLWGAEATMKLAREITDGTGIAVTSMLLEEEAARKRLVEIILNLCPQHQGRDVEPLLSRAVCVTYSYSWQMYWSWMAVHRTSALEELILIEKLPRRIRYPGHPVPQPLPDAPAQFALKQLRLHGAYVPGQGLIALLQNSWYSLTRLILVSCSLINSDTWRDVLGTIATRSRALTYIRLCKMYGIEFTGLFPFKALREEDFAEQYRPGLEIEANDRWKPYVIYEGPDAGIVLGIIAAAM